MNRQRCPKLSLVILLVIFAATLLAGLIAPYGAETINVEAMNEPPSFHHLFGTDNMGRDMFSMILYGGRASLFIGFVSSLLATAMAVLYGTISGLSGKRVDAVMMRFTELLLSLPSILLVLFLQAVWGKASYLSLSVVIGLTSWMNIAKIVRSEVRQIGESDYVLAARTMGGGFGYILHHHLLPNYVSSIMFMVVSNISAAIITESTLSYFGLGLPLTAMSWGSLLSLSQEALLTNQWWIILLPGTVLVVTLVCITNLGEYMRRKNNRLFSNL